MAEAAVTLTVVESRNVATFIRELVLAPAPGQRLPVYRPGQYVQVHIPAYECVPFAGFDIAEPYASVWRAHQLFDLDASNALDTRRNYSLATDPVADAGHLRFNVRIATPPQGQACAAGAGSSYLWSLRPGDRVEVTGPFGDFLIRDSDREMIYVGGGAGMAPLRSHLAHLFETLQTGRRVSFWYGARSRQEVFYDDYFRDLEARHPHFRFHLALSAPLPEDGWDGPVGFIHDVLRREYLDSHPDPTRPEYYLCGPPVMVQATRDLLCDGFGVAAADIAADAY
jgi:Na+-transporting NADH:ubiquinone oxidoreductase subunit F